MLMNAAKLALPQIRRLILLTRDEGDAQVVISKAAWLTAQQALGEEATEDATRHLAASMLEHISGPSVLDERSDATNLRENVRQLLRSRLAPLDDPIFDNAAETALTDAGSLLSAAELADVFLEEFTDSVLPWASDRAHVLRDFGQQLQIDRIVSADRGLIPVEGIAQATRIVGWITIEVVPPRVEIYNHSWSPIYDVAPSSPYLLSKDLTGNVVAMVGGASVLPVSQISPSYGYCWPLEHMRTWGGTPFVTAELHFTFTDAAGRRWLHGHDRISRLPREGESSPE
jgi:hypothetical protein